MGLGVKLKSEISNATIAGVIVPVNNTGASVTRQCAGIPVQGLVSSWRTWAVKVTLSSKKGVVVKGNPVVVSRTADVLSVLPPGTRKNTTAIVPIFLL